ncbi:hypothetical protein E1212_01580 [Jiangella ureilytica]|uniref:LppM domain-containing protein n=1 Tax=Jiangella ureilytica TaxID=2530374 RepID=A0A4R4S3U5_9ACTN|nr:hypothetical protein [Jiangella ureilytica]TDC56684.1 hypothetical protein E1212_01580 [Jiangella ureilytica]
MRPVHALAVAAMAVALTGCMKMDMQLNISDSDTVDGEIILALNREASAMAEAMGEDPSTVFDELGADLPEGAQAEEYDDGEFVGQRYTFDDIALSEFSAEESGFGITHEGEEIVVDGSLDMTGLDPEAMAGELGGDVGELGDVDQLMESLEMSVSMTFPGEVTEHNGELDGTTVTWIPVPGEANDISARSADSGGGGGDGIPVWIWILIVVVVLGLAALLFFLSRNRNQTPPADEAPAAGHAGSVPPPPGGAPFGAGSGPDAPTVTTEAPTAVQPPAPTPQPPQAPAEPPSQAPAEPPTQQLPEPPDQPPAEGGTPGQEPPAASR